MPKVIKDEFSERPISRQRRYQLRKRKEGKCLLCGQPTLASLNIEPLSYKFCEKHNNENLQAARARYKPKGKKASG